LWLGGGGFIGDCSTAEDDDDLVGVKADFAAVIGSDDVDMVGTETAGSSDDDRLLSSLSRDTADAMVDLFSRS